MNRLYNRIATALHDNPDAVVFWGVLALFAIAMANGWIFLINPLHD